MSGEQKTGKSILGAGLLAFAALFCGPANAAPSALTAGLAATSIASDGVTGVSVALRNADGTPLME